MMTQPGYKVDRQDDGLTIKERKTLDGMVAGKSFSEIGRELGVSRQRIGQLVSALIARGIVLKTESGGYAVVVKK